MHSFLKKLFFLSLKDVVPRAIGFLKRRWILLREKKRDQKNPTYYHTIPVNPLHSYFALPDPFILREYWLQIAEVSECFLEHLFDYHGSGWVQVGYGMHCCGVESHQYYSGERKNSDSSGHWLEGRINSNNLKESQRLWAFVDPEYIPIDWQLDFKSGYRWSETAWAQNVPFSHLPGVDIKVPWELARLQHLSQLAIAYACALRDANQIVCWKKPEVYVREFRNVVLDFIATNPPRFGVNWRSAMDVGIRAVNMLVAYDLFRGLGAHFDEEFEGALKRTMLEHGEFISEHFGWDHLPRSNHYLAHLTSLLFIGAYLPSSPIADAWLALGRQELLSEVARQFNPDGSNFEGSTSYHRLSGEMVVYSTALVAGLTSEKRKAFFRPHHCLIKTLPNIRPVPFTCDSSDSSKQRMMGAFPEWYVERIERIAEFTMHITKHSGDVVQIGDNDSGRFLRLHPNYIRRTMAQVRTRYRNITGFDNWPDDKSWWDEDILNHRHLVSAVGGLIPRQDFLDFAGCQFEAQVIHRLAGENQFKAKQFSRHSIGETSVVADTNSDGSRESFDLFLDYPGKDLREGLMRFAYPNFGLYIFYSHRLYLCIRCGPLGQEGRGGHSHNDQLSLELEVDGNPVFVDPGSFLYTPMPKLRDRYRSDQAHFGFRASDKESARLDVGLFEIYGDPHGQCLHFEGSSFLGQHVGFGCPVIRSVVIEANVVKISDWVEKRPQDMRSIYPFYVDPQNTHDIYLSVGYGKKLNETTSQPAGKPMEEVN